MTAAFVRLVAGKPPRATKARRAAKATTNAHPERTIQVGILRWLRLVLPTGSFVASIANERAGSSPDPMARARYQTARKASGMLPGLPDLIAVMPGGTCAWVECKAPGGVVSEVQQRIHAALLALGHTIIVADCIEAVRGGLQAAGVPLREAPGQAVTVARVRQQRLRLL